MKVLDVFYICYINIYLLWPLLQVLDIKTYTLNNSSSTSHTSFKNISLKGPWWDLQYCSYNISCIYSSSLSILSVKWNECKLFIILYYYQGKPYVGLNTLWFWYSHLCFYLFVFSLLFIHCCLHCLHHILSHFCIDHNNLLVFYEIHLQVVIVTLHSMYHYLILYQTGFCLLLLSISFVSFNFISFLDVSMLHVQLMFSSSQFALPHSHHCHCIQDIHRIQLLLHPIWWYLHEVILWCVLLQLYIEYCTMMFLSLHSFHQLLMMSAIQLKSNCNLWFVSFLVFSLIHIITI